MSDHTDVALAAKGDYQAFERLYRRYVIRVYSLCTRLSGSRTQGEALMRDVFLRAWEELPELGREDPFGAWLRRLAITVVMDAPQVEGMATPGIAERDFSTEVSSDVEAELPEAERLDLSEVIDELPEDARRMFVLHDVEGYKHEEIAEIFGITPGASKAQLRRARVLVRESLAG
jgi:RNA polymerase sigma-70 factor (ECF subfamily)